MVAPQMWHCSVKSTTLTAAVALAAVTIGHASAQTSVTMAHQIHLGNNPSGGTFVYAAAMDAADRSIVVAGTLNTDMLMRPVAVPGGQDGYVSRIPADGGARQMAYQFGTAGRDHIYAVAIDNSDRSIVVAGATEGGDFAGQTSSGLGDVFVARIAADGRTLMGVLQFGTSGQDLPTAIAVDAADQSIVVIGRAGGAFPGYTGARPGGSSGRLGGFVARIPADLSSLVWVKQAASINPLFGFPNGVAIDATDRSIVIAGSTEGQLDGFTKSAQVEAYVARLSTAGNQVWASQLGPRGRNSQCTPLRVAIDSADRSVVVFGTASGTFANSTQSHTPHHSKYDGFVARVAADGGARQMVHQFGTDEDDRMDAGAGGLAIDPADRSIVVGGHTKGTFAGVTRSSAWGVCSRSWPNRCNAIYVARISADGTALQSADMFGTNRRDDLTAVLVDGDAIVAAGYTSGVLPGETCGDPRLQVALSVPPHGCGNGQGKNGFVVRIALTRSPTGSPASSIPTTAPSLSPSTMMPSATPTTSVPTPMPTSTPTRSPMASAPTISPSPVPTTGSPTVGSNNPNGGAGARVDRATFDGIDANADGMISSDEFQAFVDSGGNSGGVGFIDNDNDGSMSLAEAAGAGIDRGTFDSIDADDDDTVSRDEFQTFVDGGGNLIIVQFNDEDGDGFMSFEDAGDQDGDGAGQSGTGTTSDDDGGAPIVPIVITVVVAAPLLMFVGIFYLCPAVGCLAVCKNRAERGGTSRKQPGINNAMYGEGPSKKDGFGFGADQADGYLEVLASK